MVLNHALYRAPDRTEYMREYMKTYRANSGKQDVNANTTLPSVSVSASDMSDRGCKGGPFDAFWTAYPRKIGRKAAQKAWERAKDKPELAVILSAVEVQKQSEQWCKDGGQYIPHPATWLNQGRWDDKPLVTTGAAIKRPCNIRMQYRDRTTGTWLPEGWTIPKDCPNPDNFVIQEHKL